MRTACNKPQSHPSCADTETEAQRDAPGHSTGKWLSLRVNLGLSDPKGHITSQEHSVKIHIVILLSF